MPIAKNRLEELQVSKLIQCVRDRNKDQVRKLVESGVPFLVNYGEPLKGETPLIVAAKENDEDMLQFLCSEMAALPDCCDLDGATAAMRAAQYGHVQALTLLAEAGASMTACDRLGKSILFYCIDSTQRHSQCMAAALQHKADVNQAAKDGRTAFFAACESANQNVGCCRALLEAGANPQVVQLGSGRTALMAACASGSAEVVTAALAHGADPNSLDKQGCTAAHYAARAGHFDCLVPLSGFGANFDAYDRNRQENPVHLSAARGHAMCVKFLGQRGCNPKPKNADGETPRILAKDRNHKECLKELRKVEKSFGRVGKNNEPWALSLYDWTVVRGQDLQQRLLQEFDTEGSGLVLAEDAVQVMEALRAPWTEAAAKKLLPLFDKHKDGRFDYREFLLARKYVNKLCLMAAFQPKQKKAKKGKGGRKKKPTKPPFEICTLPEEQMHRTADGGPPITFVPQALNQTDQERFHRDQPPRHPLQDDSVWYVSQPPRTFVNINDAAKHGDLESLKAALQAGYSTETRDKLYKTPLMVAAHYGNIDVAKFLLEAGANVNARDNFKWTPLHHACHAGLLDMVELLLSNGANIDAVALNGATPLLRAIETSNVMVVSYLVNRGAKMLVENRKGDSTSDLAKDWSNKAVVDIICTKFDLLAPPKDAKGGGKKKGSAAGGKKSAKGKGSAKGSEVPRQQVEPIAQAQPPQQRVEDEEEEHIRRKARALQEANALDGGYEEEEDVTVVPRSRWVQQPSTQELLQEKGRHRQRFGWQSDFADYQSPFQRNVWERIEEMGGVEDE